MRKSGNRLFWLGGSLVLVFVSLSALWQTVPVAATPAMTSPLINEFVFDIAGSDNHEYIEIWGDPNSDYSAYTILVLEGDSDGGDDRGEIQRAFTVGTTNAEGYWSTGFLLGELQNGTSTLLLVVDYVPPSDMDLDDDNDGVLDVNPPWSAIVDDISVHDNGTGDFTYGTVTLTVSFDGNSTHVDSASRIPDHTETNTPADWVRNDFDGEGLPGFVGTPESDEALNTPASENSLSTAAALVINEIDYDQPLPGSDSREFIEIKNNDSVAVNLFSYRLELINQDGSYYRSPVNLPAHILEPGDYYVVCAGSNAATVHNCDFKFSNTNSVIQNGVDAVALRFGDASGLLIDTVSYEGTIEPPFEYYTEVAGVVPGDDEAGHDGISRIPDGVDTNDNSLDFSQRCLTPGFANTTATTDCGTILLPSLALTLTAVTPSIPEPGGNVSFTVQLQNTGAVSLTVISLAEDIIGSLAGQGSCVLPLVVDVEETAVCEYATLISGSAGQQIERTITAVAEDKNDVQVQAMADTLVTITEYIEPDGDSYVYLPVILKPSAINGEPNNECSTAFPLRLDQTYSFLPEDENDWYSFVLNQVTSVQIEVLNFAPAAGQILVYSGSCTGLVQVAHDGAMGVDNVLDLGSLAAGQYTIWIINDGVLDDTNSYSLGVQTP